jgi:hypothetical protein
MKSISDLLMKQADFWFHLITSASARFWMTWNALQSADLFASRTSKLMDATKEVKNHHDVALIAWRLIK